MDSMVYNPPLKLMQFTPQARRSARPIVFIVLKISKFRLKAVTKPHGTPLPVAFGQKWLAQQA
jgi:hypothetical protein